jgi:hypothetical protein
VFHAVCKVAALVEPIPIRRLPRTDALRPSDRAFLPPPVGDALDAFGDAAGGLRSSSVGRGRPLKNCSAVQCEDTEFDAPDDAVWGRGPSACGSRAAAPLDGSCAAAVGRAWPASQAYCAGFGTRLCTLAELSRGLGWNSGCQNAHEKYYTNHINYL